MRQYLIVQAAALLIVALAFASMTAVERHSVNGVSVERAHVGIKLNCPASMVIGMAEDPPGTGDFYVWCVTPDDGGGLEETQ